MPGIGGSGYVCFFGKTVLSAQDPNNSNPKRSLATVIEYKKICACKNSAPDEDYKAVNFWRSDSEKNVKKIEKIENVDEPQN